MNQDKKNNNKEKLGKFRLGELTNNKEKVQKMRQKKTTEKFRTSALFDCYSCGKIWQDHYTSREQAYRHAMATGHKVTGEIGTSYHYNF